MSDIDDLFNETKTAEYSSYDKDDWAAKKKAERTAAFSMLDEATGELTDIAKLESYLAVQGRFDRYSVSNALLISHQRPDATVIADVRTWQDSGAYMKKGEKAFLILEPGEEYKKEDGSVGVRYNAKKVFDIAQTTSRGISEPKPVPDDKTLVKALVRSSPVDIRINNELPAGVAASYIPDKKVIFARQGMDGKDIFRALALEIAHAKLDKGEYSRDKNAFPAFCVAFVLCTRFDIEPQRYNLRESPFVGADAKEIRSVLGTVREAANGISNTMTKSLNTLSDKNKAQAR